MTWGLFYTPWNLSDPPTVSPLVLLAQTYENGPGGLGLKKENHTSTWLHLPCPPISTGARSAGPSMTLIIQGQGLGPLVDIRSTQTLALGTWAHPHLKLGLRAAALDLQSQRGTGQLGPGPRDAQSTRDGKALPSRGVQPTHLSFCK